MDILFVPSILFMIFVAPVWIVMHYSHRNKMIKGISDEERTGVDELLRQIDNLTDRIQTLESILDAEHSHWRSSNSPTGAESVKEQHHAS